ncbi:PilZ domain-containing protein [Caulobacter sp.]|uniref:PilZ domain-containing protein n=1 Tax=Caulobacter sp. TaxID=78 RepID=UPI003BAB6053
MPPFDQTTSRPEQRASPREPARRKVYLVSGSFAVKCGLVDVAIGGARIRLPNAALPQDDLYLVDTRTRLIHLTKSVWQSEREAGLQFIETETLDGDGVGGVLGAADAAAAFARRRARAAASTTA